MADNALAECLVTMVDQLRHNHSQAGAAIKRRINDSNNKQYRLGMMARFENHKAIEKELEDLTENMRAVIREW